MCPAHHPPIKGNLDTPFHEHVASAFEVGGVLFVYAILLLLVWYVQ
jgi:hypothetical protein